MNVSHPTSKNATKKRNVPKHVAHITVLVWMVILGMELTVKVKIDALYQTRETVFITQFQDSEKRVGNTVARSRVFLTRFRMLGIVVKLCFECLKYLLYQN